MTQRMIILRRIYENPWQTNIIPKMDPGNQQFNAAFESSQVGTRAPSTQRRNHLHWVTYCHVHSENAKWWVRTQSLQSRSTTSNRRAKPGKEALLLLAGPLVLRKTLFSEKKSHFASASESSKVSPTFKWPEKNHFGGCFQYLFISSEDDRDYLCVCINVESNFYNS